MQTRLSKLKKAAAYFGIKMEKPKGGSHYKFTDGTNTYPVPAHNAEKTEISGEYIRGLCRCFDLDYDKVVGRL